MEPCVANQSRRLSFAVHPRGVLAAFSTNSITILRRARGSVWRIESDRAPAVTEGLVVLDLGESGIDGLELAANAPDAGPDIRPKAGIASPRNEACVVHVVEDGAIAHVAARVRGQKMHNPELRE